MRRDYYRKAFRNPFFPQIKTKGRKVFLFVFLAVVFFVGLIFLNSSLFAITKIEVRGNQTVDTAEIKNIILKQLEENRFFVFSQKGLIFFSKAAAKEALSKEYFFDQLKIRKRPFHSLIIEISEKESAVILLTNNFRYYLDENGVALREVKNDDLLIEKTQTGTEVVRQNISIPGFIAVYDKSNAPVIIGQEAVPKPTANFIFSLNETLQERADFQIAYYTMDKTTSEQLNLTTVEGWQVYFKTTDNLESQVSRLFTTLNQKAGERQQLQYIDLRFGEKVFYK